MTITKDLNGSALTLALSGRLDTMTAPELEKELQASLDGVTELTLDLKELDYLSSAGLRVLLSAQKKMNGCGGAMTVANANSTLMEIFEVTGFADILTIV